MKKSYKFETELHQMSVMADKNALDPLRSPKDLTFNNT